MKKCMLFIAGLGLNILLGCSKGDNSEEENYNPFDTSELEESTSGGDTIYSRDSLNKALQLRPDEWK